MNALTDRDLILRARHGDTESFGELIMRYQTSVFNVCYRMTHERREAEDLTQEVFLRVYSRLEAFDLEREFGPWVRRAAVNLCLNHLEGQKVTAELDDEHDSGETEQPENIYEARERSELIRIAIAALPVQYKAVVELRHYQELSYDEIALELKIPVSDVKSHLFRARKILAEKLK